MALFRKSDAKSGTDAPSLRHVGPARAKRSRNVIIIGSTLVIKGELSAEEDLIIEGRIEGTIAHHNKHVTVGETGRVRGDIHAGSVIVLGRLVGDVYCDGRVSLAKSASVSGNVSCASLVVEDGANITGNINVAEPSEAKVPGEGEQARAAGKNKAHKVARQTAKPSVY